MSKQPLTLHITCHFAPDDVPKFFDVLRPLCEKLVQEKECMYLNVFEIHGKPGVIRLVEIWDCDMEWMVQVAFLDLLRLNEAMLMCKGSIKERLLPAVLFGHGED